MQYGDGDAGLMADIPDRAFRTVYSSHLLEHLNDPVEAIRNWYRILQPGGYLIIDVPHMKLYEQQWTLPSRFNADHKTMWLETSTMYSAEERGRYGVHVRYLADTIRVALAGSPFNIVKLRTLDEGYRANADPATCHATGEYSIEAIIRREGK
jgi:ubiquinone/menaquinone biosynthesis C-methylase UbiE